MRRILVPLVACLLLLAVSFTASFAAWSHDATSLGLKFTNRSAYYPISCSDGSGGVFVAFLDLATQRVWAQHIDATGALLWGSDGVQVGGNVAWSPESIVPDGAGGCIVSWFYWFSNNEDIYAQRVNAAGGQVWTSGGVLVCNAANNQQYSVLCPDGAGGAYVAWLDYRNNASVSDIYAQYLNAAGVAQWTANGVAVCTATGDQNQLSAAPDGSGGVILCWEDLRSVTYRAVYAQHYNAAGSGTWGANGGALTIGINADEWSPVVVSDGRTGAIIAWNDWRNGNSDVFAQRVTAAGAVLWTANGVALETQAGDQVTPAIASDGAGGAVVAWVDGRNSNNDVYAQRINALGTTVWSTSGVPVCTNAGNQTGLQVAGDGSGGLIVAWSDRRNGVDDDIYAQHVTSTGSAGWTSDGVAVSTLAGHQSFMTLASDGLGGAYATFFSPSIFGCESHVDRYGVLGGAPPAIVSVRDVPNDQGGYVSLYWMKSWLDAMPGDPISQYWLWRQVPQLAAQARLARGSHLLAAGETPVAGALRTSVQGTTTYYWEYLSYLTAQGQAGYSAVVPTRGDSVAGSNPSTLFMVEARYAAVAGEYWDSNAAGGYSVDNLAPAIPAPFTGTYAAGTASLDWAAPADADVAGYRLYRGTTAGFVPGPASLVASVTTTSFADAAGGPAYYKLSAVDVHGNESGFATLLPAGTTDVAPGQVFALAFAPPAPNPARGNCTLAFTLPAAGAARVALHDVAGRRVAWLARGRWPAGRSTIDVHLPQLAPRAQVLCLRLRAQGATAVGRIVLLP